jgi:SAM-dependent methyltransferase
MKPKAKPCVKPVGHTHVDWSQRYREGDTPWDLKGAHPELLRRIAAGEFAPPRRGARALVPGCGRGHDALALAHAGWRVTALDLASEVAPHSVGLLRKLDGELVVTDALAWRTRKRYALVFDHTFFCAIDPARRAEWGQLVRRVLAPGGRVCALAFPIDKPRSAGGPPHRMSAREQRAVLGPGFRLVRDVPVVAAADKRQWKERWVVFRRSRRR